MPLIKVQPENLKKKIDSKSILSTIQKYKKQQAEEELELGRQKAAKKQSLASSNGSNGNSSSSSSLSKNKSKRKKTSLTSSSMTSIPHAGYNAPSSVSSTNSVASTGSPSASKNTPNYSSSFSSDPFSTSSSLDIDRKSLVQSRLYHELPSDQHMVYSSELPMSHDGFHPDSQIRLLKDGSFSGTSQTFLNDGLIAGGDFTHSYSSTVRLNSLGDLMSFIPPLTCAQVYSPSSTTSNTQANGISLQHNYQSASNNSPTPISSASPALTDKNNYARCYNFNDGHPLSTNLNDIPSVSPHRPISPVNYKEPVSNFAGMNSDVYPSQTLQANSDGRYSSETYFDALELKPINSHFDKACGDSYVGSTRITGPTSGIALTSNFHRDNENDHLPNSIEGAYENNLESPVDHKFMDPSKNNLERALDDIYFEYMQVSNGFIHNNYAPTSGVVTGPFASEFSSYTSAVYGDINFDEVSKSS